MVSLVVILIGFIMFNSVPTLTPPLAPASDEEGSDNHAIESDDENTQRCVDLERDQVKNRPDNSIVIHSAKL